MKTQLLPFAIMLFTSSLLLRDAEAQLGNTRVGVNALPANNGTYNSVFGYQSMYSNTSGSYNTTAGAHSLYKNTSGNYNTASGYSSLTSNTTGYYNTASGMYSLYSNTTGFSNTAAGVSSLFGNTTGRNNTAAGMYALTKNTTGYENTATGFQALYSNTTGLVNTAVGVNALYANTTATGNTALGHSALNKNTTGSGNTASGRNALFSNTTGSYNSAFGFYALHGNTTGYNNKADGAYALFSNTTGSNNTGIGTNALFYNTTGSNNIGLGNGAGDFSYNYSNATFLGADTRALSGLTNITAVGYGAQATKPNQVMLGNTSLTSVWAAGSYVIWSDGRFKKDIREDVPGLDFINQLRPVTYHYNIRDLNKHLQTEASGKRQSDDQSNVPLEQGAMQKDEAAINNKERMLYTGFIAQEVEQAAKKTNYEFSGVHKPKNDKDVYGLSYAEFVVPLVKAVQELSKENKKLKSDIEELKDAIAKLTNAGAASGEGVHSRNTFLNVATATLEQNAPNPFENSTSISYNIPAGAKNVQLIVTDITGKEVKRVQLGKAGQGTVYINASALSSGTYHYSLLVDGQTVTSKKMVVAR